MDRLTEKITNRNTKEVLAYRTKCQESVYAIQKLGKLEDLEEQGRLLKLPCAVGDTVYTLNPLPSGKTALAETTADAFFCALCVLEGGFGKTIFATQEEEEQALKEKKGEK